MEKIGAIILILILLVIGIVRIQSKRKKRNEEKFQAIKKTCILHTFIVLYVYLNSFN